MNILDYWALPEDKPPRAEQIEALEWLAEQKAKYLILEAPVGVGKSAIALTYSRYLYHNKLFKGSSFVLTPQIILQKQYENDTYCDDMSISSFYGKSNYRCETVKSTCAIGTIAKSKCKNCPYSAARKKAKNSANTVMNYKMALMMFKHTDLFENTRKLMVCDEAHRLESFLVDFDKVIITKKMCEDYNLPFNTHKNNIESLMWIMDEFYTKFHEAANIEVDFLESVEARSSLTKTEITRVNKARYMLEMFSGLSGIIDLNFEDLDSTFIYSTTPYKMFTFSRVTGAYSFRNLMNHHAEKFLFMSATIINHKGFCRDLGLKPSDAAFLSIESTFPVKNRPVYFIPTMTVNGSWNDESREDERNILVETVDKILESHSTETGIIHTTNFKLAEYMENNIQTNHAIFSHNPDSDMNRNDAINSFIDYSEPSILISPSSTEGLDLKEDLGRFAIFVKVPYLYLGDQWVRRRLEMSEEWYQRQAVIEIIQGGGRVVRSNTDKGTVYILDDSFARLFSNMKGKFPKWWKDAYSKI